MNSPLYGDYNNDENSPGFYGKFVGKIYEMTGREPAEVWIEDTFNEQQLDKILSEFTLKIISDWDFNPNGISYYAIVTYNKEYQDILVEYYLPHKVSKPGYQTFTVNNTNYSVVYFDEVELSDDDTNDDLMDVNDAVHEEKQEALLYESFITVGYDGYDGYDP